MASRDDGRFSQRYSFSNKGDNELIYEDAPESLRCGLLQVATGFSLKSSQLRHIICNTLRARPDPSNWSEGNIWWEVEHLTYESDWYRVYDIIEAIYAYIGAHRKPEFETQVNNLLVEESIGWQLINGKIEIRGDEAFETVITEAKYLVEDSNMTVASNELHEAIQDLSRRPEPDISGAVQHAMAALECVTREVLGEPKPTLGNLVKKYPYIFPKPVDEAVTKLWGYTSEQARHSRESRNLSRNEAQLVVGISAVLCSYLTSKIQK